MGPFVDAGTVSSTLAFVAALAWKSTVVLVLAAVAARAAARRSPALRHGVWTLAVAALLALPLIQAFAPPLAAPLPFAMARPAVSGAPGAPGTSGAVVLRSEGAPVIELSDVPARTDAVGPSAAKSATPVDLSGLALLALLIGTLAVAAFFAAGRIALGHIARAARPLDDPAWPALAAEIAARMGMRRLPRFLVAEGALSPLTWGFLRPTILLPASAEQWSTAQRRAFLVHELAHVARRDCAIQEAAHVACALYWFHPGAWFAAHRLRVERELACDDRVLGDGASADAYARQLLDVVRAGRVPRGALSLSGAAMAAPSQLESRVRALLDGGRDRRGVGRGPSVVAAGLVLALLVPLAALVPARSRAAARGTTVKPKPIASREALSLDATKASAERSPLPAGVLATRWQEALTAGAPAEHGGGFWFMYAIEYDGGRDGRETLLSDSGGWTEADLRDHGPTLADRLGCPEGDAVLLFRVPAGRDRDDRGGLAFDRIALRNARLSPDLGGLPVVAIGSVPLDESLDWLLARFDEAPADRRAAVLVTAMALHRVPRTLPLLERLLDGQREATARVQAAEGLARFPGAQALEALVTHARHDVSQDVEREAAETIGELDYGPATDALIALVRELDDPMVRAEAVESLGEREPERVVPVLVDVADTDDVEMIRREAVETLGDLPGTAGLEPLRRMAMRHRDPAVRSEAVETLNDLGLRAEKAAGRR